MDSDDTKNTVDAPSNSAMWNGLPPIELCKIWTKKHVIFTLFPHPFYMLHA